MIDIFHSSLQQISPDMLPSPIRDLLGDEIGNVAKVALVILLEQKLGSVRIRGYVCYLKDESYLCIQLCY